MGCLKIDLDFVIYFIIEFKNNIFLSNLDKYMYNNVVKKIDVILEIIFIMICMLLFLDVKCLVYNDYVILCKILNIISCFIDGDDDDDGIWFK